MNIPELYQIGYRLTEIATDDFKPSRDLSLPHYLILCDLAQNGPSSVTESAQRAQVGQSRFSRIALKLEEKELVRTVRVPDGRRTVYAVTPAGRREAFRALTTDAGHVMSSLLRDLPARERRHLEGALARLHEALPPRKWPEYERMTRAEYALAGRTNIPLHPQPQQEE